MINQLREVLNREHYLKAEHPAGHVLWQSVYQPAPGDGAPRRCAGLCWGGAAWRLKERAQLIGWDPLTRTNRLGLVVQWCRFVVLEAARAEPGHPLPGLGPAPRSTSAKPSSWPGATNPGVSSGPATTRSTTSSTASTRHQLAAALNAWLAAHQGLLLRSLALDGQEVGPARGAEGPVRSMPVFTPWRE